MAVLETGKCGENLVYTVSETEEGLAVTVSGNGYMYDWPEMNPSPFKKYKDRIYEIIIEKGVKSVGDRAFRKCENLRRVSFPAGLEYLGSESFASCIMLKEARFLKGFRILSPKALERCVSLERLYFPSTLRAVDFKALHQDEKLAKVVYRGSELQWQRQVKVAPSARGNIILSKAEFSYTAESSRFEKMAGALGRIIRAGGDGKMYVAAPYLGVTGPVKGKSGECTLVVFPDGETMLIDAGAPFAKDHVLAFLKKLKINRLDYFVLTHVHGDHFGGAMAAAKYLCEEKKGGIGTYLFSGCTSPRTEELELAAYLESQGTLINRHVREGDVFDIGGVRLETFNPDDEVLCHEQTEAETVNSTSVSFKFIYGDSSFLSTGDLYATREAYIADRYGDRLRADVMKSNHHGLFTSNTEKWFASVQPKYVLTEDDGATWSAFDERLKKAKIRHLKVSEKGLCIISMDEHRNYRVKTEY